MTLLIISAAIAVGMLALCSSWCSLSPVSILISWTGLKELQGGVQ